MSHKVGHHIKTSSAFIVKNPFSHIQSFTINVKEAVALSQNKTYSGLDKGKSEYANNVQIMKKAYRIQGDWKFANFFLYIWINMI